MSCCVRAAHIPGMLLRFGMMTVTIGPWQMPCGVLAQGREQKGPSEGILCIKQAWPATIRTIKGDHDRFQQTYFSAFQARAASHSSNVSPRPHWHQLQGSIRAWRGTFETRAAHVQGQ